MNLSESITCSGIEMKKYMKSMDEKDIDKFLVLNGKLMFIGNDDYERKVAEDVGIDTSLSIENYSIEDLKVLAGNVFNYLGENCKVPANNDGTSEKLPWKRLYTKNIENDTKWDMVMDYDENGIETNRFGDGYYLITNGEYTIDGVSVKLNNNYIIDYEKTTIIKLSEQFVDWNIASTLGVTDKLELNLDPSDFDYFIDENGELDSEQLKKKNILKYGDVTYDTVRGALGFNKSNINGKNGYIELARNSDFSKGVSMEIFFKSEDMGQCYKKNYGYNMPLFCVRDSLDSDFRDGFRLAGHHDSDAGLCELTLRLGNPNLACKGTGFFQNKDNWTTSYDSVIPIRRRY